MRLDPIDGCYYKDIVAGCCGSTVRTETLRSWGGQRRREKDVGVVFVSS